MAITGVDGYSVTGFLLMEYVGDKMFFANLTWHRDANGIEISDEVAQLDTITVKRGLGMVCRCTHVYVGF